MSFRKRNSYEPFGAACGSTSIDGIGYTGHVMDQATGLTYMQQRYYDPQIGRFLSNDPKGMDPSTGAIFNRFAYANDNPYRFLDPDGRVAVELKMTTEEKQKYRQQIRQFTRSVKRTEKALLKSNSPVAAKFVATTFVISASIPASVIADAQSMGVPAGNIMGYADGSENNRVALTPRIFDLGDSAAVTDSYYGREIGHGSESNLAFGYLHEWRHDFAENAKFFPGDGAAGEMEANDFADKLLPTVLGH